MNADLEAFKSSLLRVIKNSSDTGRYSARGKLNTRPHFVPITDAALGITLGHNINPLLLSNAELVDIAKDYVTKQHSKHRIEVSAKGWVILRTGHVLTQQNIVSNTPALVYENGVLQGALYATEADSFRSASAITNALNKDKRVRDALLSGSPLHLGHTDMSEGVATTPTAQRVSSVLTKIAEVDPKLLERNATSLLKLHTKISDAFNRIEVLHATYGTQVYGTFSKAFTKGLLKVSANVVLIQDGAENTAWGREVEGPVIRELKNIVLSYHSSRNVLEEIQFQLRAAILGNKISPTNSSSSISKSQKKQTSSATSLNVKPIDSNFPKLRTLQNRSYSLTSLQALLNTHLQDVISANMGDQPYIGGQRRVLNYRTGRFASSAKVERLAESRTGMITAFYSYMKNPYQTFEPGYAQGTVKSRDPKLLISTSIRQIAATKISNQLRAVLV